VLNLVAYKHQVAPKHKEISMSKFGTNLKRLMKKKKLTGSQVAVMAQVDRSTISRILAGKTNTVSLDTVEKLASAFKVRAASLI
jgi:transcriptional regulator with XRE-family HTH domain